MKFVKSNLKVIIAFLVGMIIAGGIVYATTTASEIIYIREGRNDINSVADALNDLYNKNVLNDLNIVTSNITSIGMDISVQTDIENGLYIYVLNNEIKEYTNDKTITIDGIEPGTNCNIKVIAIEQNGTMHKGEKNDKTKDAVWVYKDGVDGEISGGFSIQGYVGPDHGGTLNTENTYMRLNEPKDKKAVAIRQNNAIDLTEYKYVYIKFYNSNTNPAQIFLSTLSNYNGVDDDAGNLGKKSYLERSGNQLVKFDISTLTSNAYIYIRKTHSGYIDIQRIWLEK